IDFQDHQKSIESLAKSRNNKPFKSYLVESYSLAMFYYGSIFYENIAYIKELNCYVCFEIDKGELHLFDYLSDEPIEVEEVLSYLPLSSVTSVYCHFKPSSQSVIKKAVITPLDDDALFVLGIEPEILANFKLPLFNHA
ncbi:MAG: hypothetical protein RSC33_05095, partial [Vagococcus sp.]